MRAPLTLVLALLQLFGCAEMGPPKPPPSGWVPPDSIPRLQRVMLPLTGENAQESYACYQHCRVSTSSQATLTSCISQCPGSQLELGKYCPGSAKLPRAVCMERIVAADSAVADKSRGRNFRTALGLGAAVVVFVVIYGLVQSLCDEYSPDPDCAPQ